MLQDLPAGDRKVAAIVVPVGGLLPFMSVMVKEIPFAIEVPVEFMITSPVAKITMA